MTNLRARSRSLAVFGIFLTAAVGLLAATQTWISVVVGDGVATPIDVAGTSALAVLAPLSLAAMALGIALSIVGRVLRWAFAVLAVVIGAVLSWITLPILTGPPTSAVASAVTDATGIAGTDSVAALVQSMTLSAWPVVALVCWILMTLVGVFALVTVRDWKSTGKKYRATSESHAPAAGPLDAVDSWDDLSRGDDPTR